MKKKPRLAAITPAKYSNPDLRKQMYDAVDCAMRTNQPITGYAFVSFHDGGAYQAFYSLPPGAAAMDLPEMVKTRINERVYSSIKR